MYSGVNFPIQKKGPPSTFKIFTLRVLSVLLRVKEIKLQSEQRIFCSLRSQVSSTVGE